jgi:hypothetical protein
LLAKNPPRLDVERIPCQAGRPRSIMYLELWRRNRAPSQCVGAGGERGIGALRN